MLIKLHNVVFTEELEVCWTYSRKQINLLYRGVNELGRLRGQAVFIVNNSTEVYVQQKTQRSFWSYGAVDKSGSTDGQSQRKFENERSVATSRQKRQRVNTYHEIWTLAPLISIECLLLAFPHVDHLPWDLNARTIDQHRMLTASIPACRNC